MIPKQFQMGPFLLFSFTTERLYIYDKSIYDKRGIGISGRFIWRATFRLRRSIRAGTQGGFIGGSG